MLISTVLDVGHGSMAFGVLPVDAILSDPLQSARESSTPTAPQRVQKWSALRLSYQDDQSSNRKPADQSDVELTPV